MAGEVRIGTSGWQYDDWRGVVYPQDLPQRRWLEHYVTRFPTVEVNSTFYRLAKRDAVRGWRDTVPDGFEFAFKGSRYLTHQRKLNDPHAAVTRFFEPLEPALDVAAVVLWQLPPRWRRNVERLDGFLAALPDRVRYAVEFRDDDWYHHDTYRVLERHGVALVWLSSSLTASHDRVRTAEHLYVRFHGMGDEPYRYRYGDDELAPWADTLREHARDGAPAWVYFNNDHDGNAVRDAETLTDLLGDAVSRAASAG
jgi:uncharacterized protein YecE (DUF72 family)